MKFRQTLSYDDVLLVPQFSDIESRNEIDIGSSLSDDLRLSLPIISSPMDTVSETKTAIEMSANGGMAVVHRYCDIHVQSNMVYNATRTLWQNGHPVVVGGAVGVRGSYMERTKELIDAGAEVICVDVAHGHHVLVEKAVKSIKDKHGDLIHLMAGNVATVEGYMFLDACGADSVRANIGGGSICSTRIQTGHGVPGLQTILDCVDAGEAKIIADGGIRNSGDIVKALAAGADFVMAGSLFAGCAESPGSVIDIEGIKYKQYRGMASKEAQSDWKGNSSHAEGISTMVPFTGNISFILAELAQGIKSGLSYTGAKNISELQSKAEFIQQTSAGQMESNTHILART